MAEATWDDGSVSTEIDWHMSAALENVERGREELPEVTSLSGAVRAWMALDPSHKADATLTPERAIMVDGQLKTSLHGEAIPSLAGRLPL